MIKIIASVLTLSLAFGFGVVLGANQHKPKIKKIAANPYVFKPSKQIHISTVKKAASLKNKAESTVEEKTAKNLAIQKEPEASPKFLNKKRTGYTVLLSSFIVEENANEFAKKISKKGYDAFYFSKEVKGKTWHGVGVGSFSSRSTAESLKKELKENRLGRGSLISEIPSNNKTI